MLGSPGSGHQKVVTRPPILRKKSKLSRLRPGRSRALTDRQRQVLGVIRRHCKGGLPPTRAEIANELKINHSAIDGHLFRLSARGYIQVFPGIERGLRLLREGAPLYEDPAELLEDAAEGRTIDLEGGDQARLDDFDSFSELFEASPDLFLRITSRTMAMGRYRPGDVVAVCCDMEPESEDVVVGRVGEDIALRRAPGLPEKDFALIGVVVGAIVGTSPRT